MQTIFGRLRQYGLILLLGGLVVAFAAASALAGNQSVAAVSAAVPKYFSQPIAVTRFRDDQMDAGKRSAYVLSAKRSAKPWKLCVAFPNGQDPYWTAAIYGVATQAQRLGVKVQIFDAGGYQYLSKQINQLENCVSSGADAVIVGAISGPGVAPTLKEIASKGIPVVAALNPISSTSVSARAVADTYGQGVALGKWFRARVSGAKGEVQVAFLPGPTGADWTKNHLDGFTSQVKGSNVKIVTTKWGLTDQSVQLKIVENVLQAYPDVQWIVGNALGADAAVGAVKAAGKSGKVKIASTFETEPVYDRIVRGSVEAVPNDGVVLGGAIAVDLAVKLLNGQPNVKGLGIAVIPTMITRTSLPPRNHAGLAPKGYKPTFVVG